MVDKRSQKRAQLRERLINAAYEQIERQGLDGLRARDIASGAGCALGGLYNVFKDLDELVLHVNLRTIAALDAVLASTKNAEKKPLDQLIALAESYHSFVMQNYNLWVALFDHNMHMRKKHSLPDWYREKHIEIFRHVEMALQALQPDMPESETAINARTLFSAVHGIVSISLQDRFVAVPKEMLSRQLREFIHIFVSGFLQRFFC